MQRSVKSDYMATPEPLSEGAVKGEELSLYIFMYFCDREPSPVVYNQI